MTFALLSNGAAIGILVVEFEDSLVAGDPVGADRGDGIAGVLGDERIETVTAHPPGAVARAREDDVHRVPYQADEPRLWIDLRDKVGALICVQ